MSAARRVADLDQHDVPRRARARARCRRGPRSGRRGGTSGTTRPSRRVMTGLPSMVSTSTSSAENTSVTNASGQRERLTAGAQQQRLDDGERQRQAQDELACPCPSSDRMQSEPPRYSILPSHDVHADAAAGHLRGRLGRREAGQAGEHAARRPCCTCRASSGATSPRSTAFAQMRSASMPPPSSETMSWTWSRSRVAESRIVPRAGLPAATRAVGGLDPVVDGVAQQVDERDRRSRRAPCGRARCPAPPSRTRRPCPDRWQGRGPSAGSG